MEVKVQSSEQKEQEQQSEAKKQNRKKFILNDFYCFCSVDIVNSTGLKLLHSHKKWADDIRAIDKEFREQDKLPFWKFLGDEWIFSEKIKSMSEFIDFFYNYVEIVKLIEENERYDQSIRGKIWIIEDHKEVPEEAIVHNRELIIEPVLFPIDKTHKTNIIIKNILTSNTDANDIPEDWISFYLDLGFRFGKNCSKYDIALSVEVAFLIASILKLDDKLYRQCLSPDHDYYKRVKEHHKEYDIRKKSFEKISNVYTTFLKQKQVMYAKETEFKGFPKPYVNIIIANKEYREDYQKDTLEYQKIDFMELYNYTSHFIKESFGEQRYRLYKHLSEKYY